MIKCADDFGVPSSSLQSIAPEHPLLTDIQEKSMQFDQAATKYSAKVAS